LANYSAKAIANEFLRRRDSSAYPQQMLIQKLAYIAHGWNLVINGQSLIDEAPLAWDNGPVYRSIWEHVKSNGYGGNNCTLIDPATKVEFLAKLDASEKSVVDHVWEKYSLFSAGELSAMTHEPNTPWSKAYFEGGRNTPLDNSEIKKHYNALAMAGREQRSN
jgi:uncharacterized phage-associated protein